LQSFAKCNKIIAKYLTKIPTKIIFVFKKIIKKIIKFSLKNCFFVPIFVKKTILTFENIDTGLTIIFQKFNYFWKNNYFWKKLIFLRKTRLFSKKTIIFENLCYLPTNHLLSEGALYLTSALDQGPIL